jgi:hypothetical protein
MNSLVAPQRGAHLKYLKRPRHPPRRRDWSRKLTDAEIRQWYLAIENALARRARKEARLKADTR